MVNPKSKNKYRWVEGDGSRRRVRGAFWIQYTAVLQCSAAVLQNVMRWWGQKVIIFLFCCKERRKAWCIFKRKTRCKLNVDVATYPDPYHIISYPTHDNQKLGVQSRHRRLERVAGTEMTESRQTGGSDCSQLVLSSLQIVGRQHNLHYTTDHR